MGCIGEIREGENGIVILTYHGFILCAAVTAVDQHSSKISGTTDACSGSSRDIHDKAG